MGSRTWGAGTEDRDRTKRTDKTKKHVGTNRNTATPKEEAASSTTCAKSAGSSGIAAPPLAPPSPALRRATASSKAAAPPPASSSAEVRQAAIPTNRQPGFDRLLDNS